MRTQRIVSTCLAVVSAALLATSATAQTVPASISFTAKLTDAKGTTMTGPIELKIAIYDAATGGARIWEEDQVSVDVVSGVLVHELGHQPGSEPLDGSVFAGQALYLDVTVNGEVLAPRVPILSVPYAIRSAVAASAEALGELVPEDVALVGHDHDDEYFKRVSSSACPDGQLAVGLMDDGGSPKVMCSAYSAGPGLVLAGNEFSVAAGGIGTDELASSAVTSAKIANGTIASSDIADGAITGADVATNTLTNADLATDSVGNLELEDNAVHSANIYDGTITNADIASDAIGNPELATNAVRTENILDGEVTHNDLHDAIAVFSMPPYCNESLALTTSTACQSLRCDSDSFYNCSGQCNQSSYVFCATSLVGYIVAP